MGKRIDVMLTGFDVNHRSCTNPPDYCKITNQQIIDKKIFICLTEKQQELFNQGYDDISAVDISRILRYSEDTSRIDFFDFDIVEEDIEFIFSYMETRELTHIWIS